MYVDLSVTINEQTPVYPGDPATQIQPAGQFANDGYNDHYISIGTHVGTHIDAPLHMLDNGPSLDQLPLETFIGAGRLIDVSDGDFSRATFMGIQSGDIVLFRTGMSDRYGETIYFEDYPAMSKSVAEFLVNAKVKMIGVDACSVDNREDFPIHKILLGSNVPVIENLTNLAALAGRDFVVHALPMKLELDGAPARVIAEIRE